MFVGYRDHHKGYEIGRPVGRMPPKSRLRSGKSIRPFSEDVREKQRALEGTPILAIAFTCRQVYLEAAPIYYNGIIWHFRSTQWLERFLETLGPKNKIQGIGMAILEAVRHIRIGLHSPVMMALAVKFPHLTRLDIFNEGLRPGKPLSTILKKTFPMPCPQKMPFLKTLNYGSKYNLDFPQVLWSRNDEKFSVAFSVEMTTQWHHFHTPRQLRLFGNAIGQEARDSIKYIHVQLDDVAMADEVLKFQNIVGIRILNNVGGALQVSTFSTRLNNLRSLKAGLPCLEGVQVQDPRDARKFLPFKEFYNAVREGSIWKQGKACDSSSEESSREATPVAWASS